MTDTSTNGTPETGNGAQQPTPQIRPLGQYIRDMSFENILVQKGSQGQVSPDVSVQVALDARKRQEENRYEVITKFSVSSKNKEGGDTLFLLELEYGGLFEVSNIPDNQLHPFLLIEGPRLMFPFVRRIVSDITHDSGFPALNLEPIDFVKIYRQSIAQRQAQQNAQAEGQASDA